MSPPPCGFLSFSLNHLYNIIRVWFLTSLWTWSLCTVLLAKMLEKSLLFTSFQSFNLNKMILVRKHKTTMKIASRCIVKNLFQNVELFLTQRILSYLSFLCYDNVVTLFCCQCFCIKKIECVSLKKNLS